MTDIIYHKEYRDELNNLLATAKLLDYKITYINPDYSSILKVSIHYPKIIDNIDMCFFQWNEYISLTVYRNNITIFPRLDINSQIRSLYSLL